MILGLRGHSGEPLRPELAVAAALLEHIFGGVVRHRVDPVLGADEHLVPAGAVQDADQGIRPGKPVDRRLRPVKDIGEILNRRFDRFKRAVLHVVTGNEDVEVELEELFLGLIPAGYVLRRVAEHKGCAAGADDVDDGQHLLRRRVDENVVRTVVLALLRQLQGYAANRQRVFFVEGQRRNRTVRIGKTLEQFIGDLVSDDELQD